MIAALSRAPAARVLRSARSRVSAGGWAAFAMALAIAARRAGSSHAADHVLLQAFGPVVLPLLAYALVGAVVGSGALSSSGAPLVAFGAAPWRVAAATLFVACAACATAGGVLALAIDAVAHGAADPPIARDLIACVYVGGLGGSAYAAWLTLGASFGRSGGGRLAFLALDWALGASDSATALATPRGHLRNLLGGVPPIDLSERTSAAALLGLALACGLLAMWRAR